MNPSSATLCVNTLRTLSIDMVQKANSGHPGLPLGAAPMAFALWQEHLSFHAADPAWPDRDRFVLSPGHGSSLLYSLLHVYGFDLPMSELQRFRQWGSKTPGHPEAHLTPGVEATTGPLGQGTANAVGMAMAERALAHRFNRGDLTVVDHFTWALVSDGDLMEGISCEAASLAGQLGLGKLIYLYDCNFITLDGPTSLTFSVEDVAARYAAYGWQVLRVKDGNADLTALHQALQDAKADTLHPSLIIVETTIGFGSPNKGGTSEAHGSPLGEGEVALTKAALGWPDLPAFTVPDEAAAVFAQAQMRGAHAYARWQQRFGQWCQAHPELAREWQLSQSGALPEGWDRALPTFTPADGQPTRKASGTTIAALAKAIPWLIGGDADLSVSTNTAIKGGGSFDGKTGAGRNIHYGVREHAMGAIANGMAYHGGVLPFVATFLVFSDYMRPAVRLAAMNHLPVIYVWTHDSVALGEDGPTHQPVEHVMTLRAIPNLVVLRPADASETVEAWKVAVTRKDGPVALALSRQKLPVFDRSKFGAASGVSRGAYVLSEAAGGPPQVALIATGSEVEVAVKAQQILAAEGIRARVVSMPSWELYAAQDEDYRQSVLPCSLVARVAVEAGITQGWERWVGDVGRIVGIDHYGASAPAEVLMERFGFTAERVAQAARESLAEAGGAPSTWQRVLDLGQSAWYDFIRRDLMESGKLASMIGGHGLRGMTTNPTIFAKAIADSSLYDEDVRAARAAGQDAAAIFETLAVRDVQQAADLFRSVYEESGGHDGLVSIEVSPELAFDADGTVQAARRLWARCDRPNVMIKIPGTLEGLRAIRTCLSEGINVNVTLLFSVERYRATMDAWLGALEDRAAVGQPLGRVASVASFFVSRVDTLVDALLEARIKDSGSDAADRARAGALKSRLAIDNARLANVAFEEVMAGARWAALAAKGARPQRPLWASTSTKNPALGAAYYVEALIGPNSVNTVPPETWEAYLKQGRPEARIGWDVGGALARMREVQALTRPFSDVTAQLEKEGVEKFAQSYRELLAAIDAKR